MIRNNAIVSIVFIVITSLQRVNCKCDRISNGICYSLNIDNLTWEEADLACRRDGMKLVQPKSAEEQGFLEGWLGNVNDVVVWTGARRDQHLHHVWRWNCYLKSLNQKHLTDCKNCSVDNSGHAIIEQGCYEEWYGDTEFSVVLTIYSVTPSNCRKACKTSEYLYAGLREGNVCSCSNTFGTYGVQAYCSITCEADSSKICGGLGMNSVLAVDGYYAEWAPVEPSGENVELNCGVLDVDHNYLLNDKQCNDKYTYICIVPDSVCVNMNNDNYHALSNRRCLYFSDISRTWFNARQNCYAMQGDLLNIDNEMVLMLNSIRDWLRSIIYNELYIWVGLTREFWGWADGSDIIYNNMNDNEPTSLTKDCVILGSSKSKIYGKWLTERCNARYQYMCQQDVDKLQKNTMPPLRNTVTYNNKNTKTHVADLVTWKIINPTKYIKIITTTSAPSTVKNNQNQVPQTGKSTASGGISTLSLVFSIVLIVLILILIIIIVIIWQYYNTHDNDRKVVPVKDTSTWIECNKCPIKVTEPSIEIEASIPEKKEVILTVIPKEEKTPFRTECNIVQYVKSPSVDELTPPSSKKVMVARYTPPVPRDITIEPVTLRGRSHPDLADFDNQAYYKDMMSDKDEKCEFYKHDKDYEISNAKNRKDGNIKFYYN